MKPDESDAFAGDDEADLAVLDMALAERCRALAPPDLWPLPAAAVGAPARPRAVARGGAARLAAALLLLTLGAAAAWVVSRAARDEASPLADRDAPRTLAELQQWLATAGAAHASACGAWDSSAVRWVVLPRHGLDTFLRFGLRPELDRDDLRAVVAAVAAASVRVDAAAHASPGANDVVWSHELDVDCGARRCTLLLQAGGPGAARLAFRGANGPVELSAHGFLPDGLREQLAALTVKTIADLGFVVGAAGMASIPDGATGLRLLGVPANAVAELARFDKLSTLDLTRAPEWHRVDVLRALPRRLQQLVCRPSALSPDAYVAIGALTGLRELHLVGADAFAVAFQLASPEPAPSLDDGALHALAGLRSLHELTLGGGAFTDDGVAALAALPALDELVLHGGGAVTDVGLRALARCPLRRLAITALPLVRGTAFRELSTLRTLSLDGEALDRDLLAHVAALPELRELSVRTRTTLRLDALPLARSLRKLSLDGPFDRGAIVFLERCASLERLGLRTDPPLRDEELVLLHGLRQLRQLRQLKLESPLLTNAARDSLRAALPGCTVGTELH